MTPPDVAAIRWLVERARGVGYQSTHIDELADAIDSLLTDREARGAELAEARSEYSEACRAFAMEQDARGVWERAADQARADLARVTAERDEARDALAESAKRAPVWSALDELAQRTLNVSSTILGEIRRERDRQEALRASGKFLWTCADASQSNTRKLAVLAEEFGEVSREVTEEIIATDKGQTANAHDARARLRAELIQVAAVAVAWVESLECPGASLPAPAGTEHLSDNRHRKP